MSVKTIETSHLRSFSISRPKTKIELELIIDQKTQRIGQDYIGSGFAATASIVALITASSVDHKTIPYLAATILAAASATLIHDSVVERRQRNDYQRQLSDILRKTDYPII